MNDDFLTQERIQRLQLMGVSVWQERGKRAPAVAEERRAPDLHTDAPDHGSRSRQSPVRAPQPTVADVPPPDASSYDWQQLRAAVSSCKACVLCSSRSKTVFGVGDQNARVMVIGEAPGAEEDRRGEPFVGRAGQLLDAMLLSIGLVRSQVFIANVLKCRPPGNRDPQADEARQCASYLKRQIELVGPDVIVTVGRVAAQHLLGTTSSLGRMRGNVHTYGDNKIPCVVTYHPAYLLRSPDQKRKAWEDLLMGKQLIKDDS